MDEFHGKSIFIAATHLEEELDNAIWRRFDTRMTYALPGKAELEMFLMKLIGNPQKNADLIDQAKDLLLGCSFADIEQIILKAKRRMIIEDSEMSYNKIVNAYEAYNPRRFTREVTSTGV